MKRDEMVVMLEGREVEVVEQNEVGWDMTYECQCRDTLRIAEWPSLFGEA